MTVWISRRPDRDVASELAAGRGPLAGIRLAVMDDVDVAGLPTTAACPEFAYLPDRDAAPVAALRAAGAVVVGKTNMDQFATGGAGSGAAVAVAADEADIAIVSGAAESGRMPAALQGIVAITPTSGVISTEGVVPAHEPRVSLLASGIALADRAMAVLAAEPGDRRWPADTRLAAPPNPVVAVPRDLPALDPTWREAFARAVGTLSDAGGAIVEIDVGPFLAAGALAAPVTGSRDRTAREVNRDRAEVFRLRRVALSALEGGDVLLVPTAPTHPRIDEAAANPVGVDAAMRTFTQFCDVFDMCGVAVPAGTAGDAQFGVTVLARAFEDAVALDVAAMLTGGSAPVDVWPLAALHCVELVVFGAHLRGGPLAHQLTDRGARFAGEIATAPRYRMTALDTAPPKPAVTRVRDGTPGSALTGHRWLLSTGALGAFLAALPAPMQLGKVEMADGTWRTGFGCDGEAAAAGTDLSGYGSWTAALAQGAVG
ncbi:allophanate hydrolase [Mycobacterium manitobense]|uniref:Allophanate hydrolase n=1 Tax=[Mycobacterium] manitobense TaxID=190147 RepID=A0A9X2YMB1_9MYCO|nr:amidase family protein [[Mycobacterium] manitobense]MCV7169212.1 allophanate hydrolase [[Mycobacterium] manitobense]